ncbi:helix-turn-helix domain-containing protein [Cohnella cellulosilytica]|uniref:Helix-turn-helix domain-containing protein n=1 Tax=Cohnella cellulosilytica TaxID=986710 RepID=A0ABW2F878_9BACL
MKIGTRTLSYLQKLVLFGFVLSALPTTIIGGYSYYKSSVDARAKAVEMNLQTIRQTHARVEQIVGITDRFMLQFLTSPLAYSSLNSKMALEEFQTLRDLKDELFRMQIFDLGIADMTFVNLENGWFVNNSGKRDLPELSPEHPYVRFGQKPANSFWGYSGDFSGSTASCELQLVKKLPIYSLQPTGLLIADIPCSYIKTVASQIVTDGYFFIVDEENRLLTSNYENATRMMEPDFFRSVVPQNQDRSLSGIESVYIDKEKYLLTYQTSQYNRWTYIKATPFKRIDSESRAIGWATVYLVLGMLAICLSLIALGTRRLYYPISRLYQTLSNILYTTESVRSKNEINVIQSGVTRLLDYRIQLNADLEAQKPKLKDYFSLKLVNGGMNKTEIAEKLSQYGHSLAWRQFAVFAIDIDTLEGTAYKSSDQHLLMFAINNIVSEIVPPPHRLNPVLTDQAQITIIADSEGDADGFNALIDGYAEKIRQTTREYLKLKISIGVSRVYERIEETPNAYREGLEALKYRIRHGQEAILYIDELEPKTRGKFEYPEQSGSNLLDTVKFGDERAVVEALDLFIGDLFREERYPRDYQIMLSQLLYHLTTKVPGIEECFGEWHKDGQSVYDQLFELTTKPEIEAWLRDRVIKPIVRYNESKKTDQSAKISQDIIKMIHERYDTDLSLEFCAEQLNYHPNYIRRVFRQQTGVNFSDYLTSYRMAKVKKWLAETDMRISEIAEKVNYQNSQNLIRSFRKIEGMTPGAYRTKVRK